MRLRWLLPLFLLALLTACQPAPPEPALPTLAVLPSLTPTATVTLPPTVTDTPQPSATPTETLTPTITSTPTDTPEPTLPPRATATLLPTVEPTLAAIGTATEAVLEQPKFMTLTPPPLGTLPPTTPQQLADVVITQAQFQEALNTQLSAYPSIQRAVIDFVPDGMNVELTALGGEAFITGSVFVSVILTGDFATIGLGDIVTNAPAPPEAYVNVVTGDFMLAMLGALDATLRERLGPDQDLSTIKVDDEAMRLTLLVPNP